MVELWRSDSWTTPPFGEDLEVLRPEVESEPLSSKCLAFQGTTSGNASGLLGSVSTLVPRSGCALSYTRAEPVLRGPAGRTSLGARMNCGVNLQFSNCSAASLEASEVTSPECAGDVLDYSCELPCPWEVEVLPEETAWIFDPSYKPPSVDCEGGSALKLCTDEPKSPTSVFQATSGGMTDSASGSVSSCSDIHRTKGIQECYGESESRESGPECSEDTTMERRHLSGMARKSLVASKNNAHSVQFGTNNTSQVAHVSPSDGQELTSRPSKKVKRSTVQRPTEQGTASDAHVRHLPSSQSKKQKGRQACVQCFTISTPQWREGPQGARTLCNACGVRYRKQLNMAKKLKSK
mmetsp:Transcript_28331/g.67388  ORF Transcript_28331/g.67388 Transcript_28331/m.67388 type:complete len:351 (+) Transcript_28331:572-1624(+)